MRAMATLVHICDVEVIGPHELRLTFEDGAVSDERFDENEWRGVFEPLRDRARFAEVSVDREIGTIVRPGGLDMTPEPLYQEACQRPVAHASLAR